MTKKQDANSTDAPVAETQTIDATPPADSPSNESDVTPKKNSRKEAAEPRLAGKKKEAEADADSVDDKLAGKKQEAEEEDDSADDKPVGKEEEAGVDADSADDKPAPTKKTEVAPGGNQDAPKALQELDEQIARTKKQIELTDLEAQLAEKQKKKVRAGIDEATGALDAKLKYKTKQREAIKALLDSTKGDVPKLFREIDQELQNLMSAGKNLAFDGPLTFTENALRLPALPESLQLTDASDFFKLKPTNQLDLYDRIGLFKGIVVDHGMDVPVAQGYRDVVRFAEISETNSQRNVQIFYRKPRLSGYLESTYALDEAQRKTQQSGIFNLSFSLSASYSSWGMSAALRAGYAQRGSQHEEKSTHTQKVSITSNFFLPKIELSLETLQPVAAPAFVAAVQRALGYAPVAPGEAQREAKDELPREQQFAQLNRVLREFGHFVATSLVVGGRLYSTQTKTIEKSQSLRNKLEETAGQFQAALETWTLDVGVSGQYNSEEARKQAEQQRAERQHLQMHAVGGDGVYVNDTARWVQSLAEYSGWSLVRFDNLVPSIQLLPAELYQRCHNLLTEVTKHPDASIESLLEQQAHYLFYTGYLEAYGRWVEPRYYVLKGTGTGKNVLSVVQGRLHNDADVKMLPYEEAFTQQWWLAPDGRLHCRGEQDEPARYVLALNGDKLVINQEDYFENQNWQLAGGMLKNLGTNQYLIIESSNAITVGDESAAKKSRNVWQATMGQQLSKLRLDKPKDAEQVKGDVVQELMNNRYLVASQTLVSPNGGAVLRMDGAKLLIEVKEHNKQHRLYEKTFGQPISQLRLDNGQLLVQFSDGSQDTLASAALSSGYRLALPNCGNLELTDREGNVIWESGSAVYVTFKRGGSNAVLSYHHYDEVPKAESSIINLTTLPFVQVDHQLWYVSGSNQIISKLKRGNGQKMALTALEDGSVKLQPLNYKDKAQQWTINDTGFGPLLNQQTGKYLQHHSGNGRMLRCENEASATWELKTQSLALSKATNELLFRVAPSIHKESEHEGYLHFDKFGTFVHLDVFALGDKEFCGMRVYKNGNRFAVQAMVRDAQNIVTHVESHVWDEGEQYAAFNRNEFRLDNSPVYLDGSVQKFGLQRKGNAYALSASGDGTVFANEDESRTMRLLEHKMDFVDTTTVLANDDEVVVGFGFTRQSGNRAAPYLLVRKK